MQRYGFELSSDLGGRLVCAFVNDFALVALALRTFILLTSSAVTLCFKDGPRGSWLRSWLDMDIALSADTPTRVIL